MVYADVSIEVPNTTGSTINIVNSKTTSPNQNGGDQRDSYGNGDYDDDPYDDDITSEVIFYIIFQLWLMNMGKDYLILSFFKSCARRIDMKVMLNYDEAKLNNELLNNLGNFINHMIVFLDYRACKGSGYNSIIPNAPGAESNPLSKALTDNIDNYVDQYVEAMEKEMHFDARCIIANVVDLALDLHLDTEA
nr:probable methionine--tRNA ligase [Tanacetum cinerariifolium]